MPNGKITTTSTAAVAALSFLWAGLLIGVSGLSTPIKFTAPSLTLAVGLDVGRVTFHLFNRIELGLAALLLIGTVVFRVPRGAVVAAGLMAALVAAQAGWLLPGLDARVDVILAGGTPAPSSMHLWYIVVEGVKLVLLFGLGLGNLRHLLRSG